MTNPDTAIAALEAQIKALEITNARLIRERNEARQEARGLQRDIERIGFHNEVLNAPVLQQRYDTILKRLQIDYDTLTEVIEANYQAQNAELQVALQAYNSEAQRVNEAIQAQAVPRIVRALMLGANDVIKGTASTLAFIDKNPHPYPPLETLARTGEVTKLASAFTHASNLARWAWAHAHDPAYVCDQIIAECRQHGEPRLLTVTWLTPDWIRENIDATIGTHKRLWEGLKEAQTSFNNFEKVWDTRLKNHRRWYKKVEEIAFSNTKVGQTDNDDETT